MKQTAIIFVTLFFGLCNQALALDSKQLAMVSRAEDYLNKLTTVTADFTQTAQDGSISKGKFFLSRPGKMRWQYITPTPLVIMANGSKIVYFDKELDQTSYLPVNKTPAGVLLKDRISLSEDTKITAVESKSDILSIRLESKDDSQKGSISFEFSNKHLMLKNLFIEDEIGHLTSINLLDAQYGDPIDPDMFRLLDSPKWNGGKKWK